MLICRAAQPLHKQQLVPSKQNQNLLPVAQGTVLNLSRL
jgi:hypothetical protein